MKLYAHIKGDNFTILNEKDANNRLLKEPSAIMQEVGKADNDMSGGASGYKLINGIVIAKTKKEINDELKILEKEDKRKEQKNKRIEKLKACIIIVNGKPIQARESDEMYLRRAIESMQALETRKWILADNSVGIVSREELEQALNEGLALGQQSFDEYINWLENQD
jgi:hypothetical protein